MTWLMRSLLWKKCRIDSPVTTAIPIQHDQGLDIGPSQAKFTPKVSVSMTRALISVHRVPDVAFGPKTKRPLPLGRPQRRIQISNIEVQAPAEAIDGLIGETLRKARLQPRP